jgi:hypothetical protein
MTAAPTRSGWGMTSSIGAFGGLVQHVAEVGRRRRGTAGARAGAGKCPGVKQTKCQAQGPSGGVVAERPNGPSGS